MGLRLGFRTHDTVRGVGGMEHRGRCDTRLRRGRVRERGKEKKRE